MCGITGFCLNNGNVDIEGTIRLLTDKIEHRGPDCDGFWTDMDAGIALGHRRLSIIDLSPTGNQPMMSHSGRYIIVYNGEVYNYQDIQKDIKDYYNKIGESRSFSGTSDTEVILEAIELFGIENAVKSFVGMFAFAVFDRQERRIHLVRDRIGEKPLYYGFVNSAFLFASELKAIRAFPGFNNEISRDVLSLYFRYNYIPAPYSIYEDIYKLTPGSILTFDIRTMKSPEIKPYWSAYDVVKEGLAHPFPGEDEDAIVSLESLLRKAIKGQMMSDVPLGAFLSGGIDSSLIVSLMQAESSRPVKTFTIGFNETGYNEAIEAKRVANFLGTEHTELYINPEEARSVIPLLPDLYDEPFSDSSQIPTYLVSKLARTKVTVSLSGDGGDELFGGYNRYFETYRIWNKIGRIPQGLRKLSAKGILGVSPNSWDHIYRLISFALPSDYKYKLFGDKVHKLARVLGSNDIQGIYNGFITHWNDSTNLVRNASEIPTALNAMNSLNICDQRAVMMYLDLITYLPDDILVKVDRAAMGVSLETRVPFLDHRVIEFAWKLPPAMKFKENKGKWILREILSRYIPREMFERPKMGFGVPIGDWMRGPLREWTESLINEDKLKNEGYLNPELIRQRWDEHLSGAFNWQYHIWDILMFEAWLDKNKSV